jgi:lipopolysaccharide transport system ATP-binding protein
VLFVSHNMPAVQGLCKRVIWLRDGEIAEAGEPGRVVQNYLGEGVTSETMEKVWDDPADAPGNDQVRLHRVCVRPVDGSPSDAITVQTPLMLEFEYWNFEPDARLNLSLHLYDHAGTTVFNTAPVHEPVWHGRQFPVGLFRSVCYIPGELLNDGLHRVLLLVVKDESVVIYSHKDVLAFEVNDAIERRGLWYGKWEGAVRPNLKWQTELLTDAPLETIKATETVGPTSEG